MTIAEAWRLVLMPPVGARPSGRRIPAPPTRQYAHRNYPATHLPYPKLPQLPHIFQNQGPDTAYPVLPERP